MRDYELWIGGGWAGASRPDRMTIIDPATEEAVGSVPAGTAEDVDRAVEAAQAAFRGWWMLPPEERVDMLHEAARKMIANKKALGETLTYETGRLLARNEFYVEWSARVFRFYAELARNDQGRVIPSAEPDGQLNMVIKQPYGVVGCIVPWNYPILLLAWKMAPALAAGNTVVIKPATQTPLATLEMVETCFDHLPPGVVNVVTGPGREVGEALAAHPGVPVVAFTGSTQVGQRLIELSARHVKKLHLELGGKDPAIVCEDADLSRAVPAVAWAGFLNGGQVCTSTERIYVQESIYEEFNERLAAFARGLAVGSGFDPESQVTPMISASARDSVHQLVQEAVEAGARLLAGGQIDSGRRGFFYPPTVVADTTHDMRIMREETFGPVVTTTPYRDFDEAIRLANDSEYALGASLYTHDPRRVRRFYTEVPAGTAWVNDPLVDNIAGPFGGMKMSGMGRELGEEGLDEFRQVKHVHWDIEGRAKPWWFNGG
ncbi:MAG TPA: aldehyde dehydrogenase family protein [Aggregatilineales bacterium]|nr:aldehyde dehydrogenase family protein [Aggregatilineales bacterium]HQA67874.1 aldehyde dehydrogenase family protein [Aggregatilineales bacterium]HQE18019.1 aldehyde dehydrogenase family protein [Aggregatilineales bacterium]